MSMRSARLHDGAGATLNADALRADARRESFGLLALLSPRVCQRFLCGADRAARGLGALRLSTFVRFWGLASLALSTTYCRSSELRGK